MTAVMLTLWIIGTCGAAAAGFSLMEAVMDWFWDRDREGAALVSAYVVGLGPAVVWNLALLAVVAP